MRATAFVLVLGVAWGQEQTSRHPEEDEERLNEKRAEWFLRPRVYPGNSMPPLARIEAAEHLERLTPKTQAGGKGTRISAAGISATQWTSIGPQPIGSGNPYAGRVFALAVDPRNGNVAYAGVHGGGVWKTTNGGVSWTALTDGQPSLAIKSLALAPSSPDTIYAGTGGPGYNYGGSFFSTFGDFEGAGMLKSVDGGSTWSRITGPFLASGRWRTINSVAVSPANSQLVLAAAQNIYRSADGGNSWTVAKTADPNCGAMKIAFDPVNPSRVFASLDGYNNAASPCGIHQSLDGGLTWTPANGSGSGSLPVDQANEIGFAVSPSNANTLYATLRSGFPPASLIGFYRSADAGTTWTKIGNPQNDNIAYWRWVINVHPLNPNVIFAGLLNLHQSRDGGQTWNQVMTQGDVPHADQQALAFSADGAVLYAGNDGGVWSAANPGAAAFNWTNRNTSFATALFTSPFVIHPSDVNFTLAGTQDNGTLRFQGAPGWDIVQGGDGGYTAVDPAQNIFFITTIGRVSKTAPGGSLGTLQDASSGINLQEIQTTYPPMVMDPSNPQRLYYGTYRVYRTTNSAAQWSVISPDLSGGMSLLTSIAVAPNDPNTVYTAGCPKTHVSRNALSGATWTDISAGLPGRCVSQIVVHPQDPQTAYAAMSGFGTYTPVLRGHVYRTTNAGATWADASGNLPDIPVNDLVIDPDLPGTLYVATDFGIYRTLDGGVSWLPPAAGLPNAPVLALRLHRPTRTLRAATHGRGMWDLWAPLSNQVHVTISSSPAGAVFSLEDGTTYQAPVTFSWTPGTNHTVTWLPFAPFLPGARFSFQSWSDGGPNPRNIAVPGVDASYSANVKAQYQLTTGISPAGAGAVIVSPASPDGFYDAGSIVQVTSVPAPGYQFTSLLGGDAPSHTSPTSLAMTMPRQVTANFSCLYSGYALPGPALGPGPAAGILALQAGAGCPWSLGSNAPWISVGPPASGTGSALVPFSIAPNTGAARSSTVTAGITLGGNPFNDPVTVTQEAATSGRPSVMSVTPSTGSGAAPVFTLQIYAPNGYQSVNLATLVLDATPSTGQCAVKFTRVQSQTFLSLRNDDGLSDLGPIALPGNVTLQNSRCALDVSRSSVSGLDKVLSLNIALTFLPPFSGARQISAVAIDSVSGLTSAYAVVGSWTVTGAGCTYSLSQTATSMPAAGGAGTVAINPSGGNCGWGAVSNAPWITIASGAAGAGAGTVGYSVSANTGGARTGTVTIGGQAFSIVQAGAIACDYSLSSASLNASAAAGSGSVNLTTSAACNWTVTSDASWLTRTSSTGGSGGTSIGFSYFSNTQTATRVAHLIIRDGAGAPSATFTLTQAGSTATLATRRVTLLYQGFLNREPDPGGLAFWITQDPANLGVAFYTSDEFKILALQLVQLYRAFYGREPLYDTEYLPGLVAMRSGASTPASLAALLAAQTGLTSTAALINAMCANVNQGAGAAAIAACVTASSLLTSLAPANAAVQFIQSPSYPNAAARRDAVYLMYTIVLNRTPDQAGFDYWLGVMTTNNLDIYWLVTAFVISPEFQLRLN